MLLFGFFLFSFYFYFLPFAYECEEFLNQRDYLEKNIKTS